MAKTLRRKFISLILIFITIYGCYLYLSNSNSATERRNYVTKVVNTESLFSGERIGSSTIEIERYHSAPPCQSSPFILLAVNSHARHKYRRQSIRKSWGSTISQNETDNLPAILWKTVFIVGIVKDNKIMEQVYEEARLHKDIVLGIIDENRRSLTEKTVLGMLWAQLYCQPTFFYKGDDDVWVNQFRLYIYAMQANRSFEAPTNSFWRGFVAVDNRKPIRNKSSKYYLSMQDFSGDLFPPFCSGFAYILSNHVLQEMTRMIKEVEMIPLVDDVYVGLLANKSGIRPSLEGRFHLRSHFKDLNQEILSALAKHRVLTAKDQVLFKNISYRHYLTQFCNKIMKRQNIDYFDDFQYFYQFNFHKQLNCSDINLVT